MKSMTDGERILLEHMEQAAAHMHDLRSMLELFLELCPFSCEGLSADGQRQRRLLGLRFLSGFEDLLGYYHRDLSRVIAEYYPPEA